MIRHMINKLFFLLITLMTTSVYAIPSKVILSGQAQFVVNSAQGKLLGTAPVKGELSIDFDRHN